MPLARCPGRNVLRSRCHCGLVRGPQALTSAAALVASGSSWDKDGWVPPVPGCASSWHSPCCCSSDSLASVGVGHVSPDPTVPSRWPLRAGSLQGPSTLFFSRIPYRRVTEAQFNPTSLGKDGIFRFRSLAPRGRALGMTVASGHHQFELV